MNNSAPSKPKITSTDKYKSKESRKKKDNNTHTDKPKKTETKKPKKEQVGDEGKKGLKETQPKKEKRRNQPLGKPLLTTQQVARHLGKKKKTLENWRGKGKGPEFIKFENGSVRYEPRTVRRWIRRNRRGGEDNG